MTPGEEALREAARLESARVYGQLCREQTPTERRRQNAEQHATVHSLEAAREKRATA